MAIYHAKECIQWTMATPRNMEAKVPAVEIGGEAFEVTLYRRIVSEAPVYFADVKGIGFLSVEELDSLADMVAKVDGESNATVRDFVIGTERITPVATTQKTSGPLEVANRSGEDTITITNGGRRHTLKRADVRSFITALDKIREEYIASWRNAMDGR